MVGECGKFNNFPCWQRFESHLQDSVRHLCDKQCFLRAFTPYRECFNLQRRLTASPDVHPRKSHLDGWTCHLVAESRPPKILFQDDGGSSFLSTNRVLKFCQEDDATEAEIKKGRKRRQDHFKAIISWRYPHASIEKSIQSPLGLIEELFSYDPWRLLLSTIFLNRTTRVQVDHILFAFLNRWDSPQKVLKATTDEIVEVIRPLGICYRRADGIKRFSRDYVALVSSSREMTSLTKADVMGLYHCGTYAYDAYRIFVQRDLSIDPDDIALKTYVEYKLALRGQDKRS